MRSSLSWMTAVTAALGAALGAWGCREPAPEGLHPALAPPFLWRSSDALVAAAPDAAVKDPSAVWHAGRWHLFTTSRNPERAPGIEYRSFPDWSEAGSASPRDLGLGARAASTPQIFFFPPHDVWYLVHQSFEPGVPGSLRASYSTTRDVSDPASWSTPETLFAVRGDAANRWVDFWVIGDAERVHLFFTSQDGRLWRADTRRDRFPSGWSRPAVALAGSFYEAAHVFALKDDTRYVAIIEARAGIRRFQQAWIAQALDGPWSPLATTRDDPFAALSNTVFPRNAWSHSISHGELLRSEPDDRMLVDPDRLRFVYQGVHDTEKRDRAYPDIPWKLGLLDRVR